MPRPRGFEARNSDDPPRGRIGNLLIKSCMSRIVTGFSSGPHLKFRAYDAPIRPTPHLAGVGKLRRRQRLRQLGRHAGSPPRHTDAHRISWHEYY